MKTIYSNYDCSDEYFYDWELIYIETINDYLKTHNMIAFGSVGRWDGSHSGWMVVENIHDFYDLIDGCRYFELTDDEGHLFMKCSHHDGTNYYELKELTNKGYEYYRNYGWYKDNRSVGEYLINSNFNSRLPRIEF